MSYLTRWEIEDLRPDLDRMVAKVIGNTDSSIRNIVENCLYSGFDRKRTTEKLSDVLDSKKASRMYDKLEDILHDYRANAKTRKRPHEDDARKEKEYKKPKPTKQEREFSRDREQDATAKAAVAAAAAAAAAATHSSSTGGGGLLPLPSPPSSSSFSSQAAAASASAPPPPQVTTETNLTSTQITQMMMNAQREIEERKRALSAIKNKDLPPAAASLSAATNAAAAAAAAIAAAIAAPRPQLPPQTSSLPAHLAAQKLRPSASIEEIERAKKIADLQAQIRAKLSGIGSQAGSIGGGGTILPPQVQEKPKPLILDEEGRTVDTTGRTISLPTLAPTLKANIRAKKKEIFNKASQPAERSYEEEGQKFVDERIVAKSAMRTKRSLRFHEPGKFQQMAERMRMKSQLEKLQNEISQIARKTGISSATKLALIAPKQDSHADDVPQMEWWDSVILTNDLNTMDGEKVAIRESAITNLIEHPTQMKPPSKCVLYLLPMLLKFQF